MKPTVFLIGLFLLGIAAHAQDVEKDDDDHQLERQQWFYNQREFPLGHIPTGARINAIEAVKAIERAARQGRPLAGGSSRAVDASTWNLIGPRPTESGTNYVTSGRVNSIAIDPRDNNTVYIGAAEGGVWKTTDGGVNWTSLTDDQPSIATGAVALDPTNPDTVYVGTGEENFAGDSYYGAGILKSTDAGATWTNIVGPFLRARIGYIAVHPTNGRVLLCTSDTGLWRSTDGAANWTRVLTGIATSVAFDPSNGDVAYAALGAVGGSSSNGVYKSTDGGANWVRSNGSGANSIPTLAVGRITLALASSNPSTMYASIADSTPGSTSGALLGIWKTTDGAETWNKLSIPAALVSLWSKQMWYDNALAVSPSDSKIVVAGGLALFRSMDGGNTWQVMPNIGPNRVQIHVDQHYLAFTPDATKLYVANDGGIYSTTDATVDNVGSINWTSLNTTLAITQFYPGFSLHPTDPAIAIGGTQDNGTQRYSGQPVWNNVTCGDGGFAAIDPSSPGIVYSACQNIQINLTSGNALGWLPASYGIDQSDRTQFISPLVIDPQNPQTLYFGTFRLWRSTDSAGRWTPITTDLSNGRATIKTIAVAPSDSNTIYVGTSDALIQVTRNAGDSAGSSWTRSTQGLPTRSVTHIAVDPIDPSVAYATFSGFAIGTDTLGHVFRTADAGLTWTDISGNLPNMPMNDLVIDPDRPGTLYVATDAGVMISTDNGASWNSLGNGLPRVVVSSLALHRPARILRAATHGRSVWEIGVPLAGASAQPTISAITPAIVNAGAGEFIIAVTGANFGTNTRIRWNGTDRGTSVIDSSHIQVAIPSHDVASIGRASLTAFDPNPGAGSSNAVAFTIGPAPASNSNAVVSAANPLGGNSLGQRSIATLYGTNLSAHTGIADSTPPLPFTLGGTTMSIGGNIVPMFFVSPGQINFQVPFLNFTRATTVPLIITQGLLSTTFTVTVAPYAPAIFTTNAQGSGQASALINGTGSLAAPAGAFPSSRPIKRGEYLALYGTGLGDVTNRPGLGGASPTSPLAATLTKPIVTLGDQPVDPTLVVFSGLAPSFVGLYQVNFQIPATAPVGDAVPVTLAIGGLTSNAATIAIQ